MLLQVVPDARDIRRHFDAIGQPDARDLAQRGVGLLRRLRENTDADAAFLWAHLKRRTLRLRDDLLAPLANELTDSRHMSNRSEGRSDSSHCKSRTGETSAHALEKPCSVTAESFTADPWFQA